RGSLTPVAFAEALDLVGLAAPAQGYGVDVDVAPAVVLHLLPSVPSAGLGHPRRVFGAKTIHIEVEGEGLDPPRRAISPRQLKLPFDLMGLDVELGVDAIVRDPRLDGDFAPLCL